MTRESLLRLLEAVAEGRSRPEEALDRLGWLPVEEVVVESELTTPIARADHHRVLRNGYPEVVLCTGKSVAQVIEICRRHASHGDGFLATRAETDVRAALAREFPDASLHDLARVVHLPSSVAGAESPAGLPVLVVSAGTGDVPVAEEAAVVAEALGNPVERLYDVGVAGIHRLLGQADTLRDAGVIVVVAGMEGALPSVVGGLVAVPVIAVPTSVGYGASFGGVAALLSMLNSCAAGVTVVNIDNGFGAACAATRINQAIRWTPRD